MCPGDENVEGGVESIISCALTFGILICISNIHIKSHNESFILFKGLEVNVVGFGASAIDFE